MKMMLRALLVVACVSAAGPSRASDDAMSNAAERFATLPDGVRYPEGIAGDPRNGQIYVGTFDFGPNLNKLLRYAPNGHLLAQRDFGPTPLLGLAFNPADNKVYIANMGASKIQRIEAGFTAASPVQDVAVVPKIGSPGMRTEDNPDGSTDSIIFGSSSFPAPNGMTFDSNGALYVSDSFQGAIYRIDNAATCVAPCVVSVVIHSALLATAGFPPFGANGLALSRDETTLYIANTGDDRVLKLDLGSLQLSVFTESINGADGLARDLQGRLWVAANQADEVVSLNDKGRVSTRLGSFRGIRHDGAPQGLLFPASMAILGDQMYVTNLALPLTSVAGDEIEEEVTRWTISRIKLPQRTDH